MLRNFVWLYFILFLLLWTLRELWFINYLDTMEPIIRGLVSAFIKISIWIIPVIIIVKKIERKDPFIYLGLRHNFKKGLKWAGVMSIALIAYFISVDLIILHKEVNLSIGFSSWLNVIILVGIIEEIVFRGYLLSKFSEICEFWKANFVTSMLFVLIHFPICFLGVFWIDSSSDSIWINININTNFIIN